MSNRLWLTAEEVNTLDTILRREYIPLLSENVWMSVCEELIAEIPEFKTRDSRKVLIAWARYHINQEGR